MVSVRFLRLCALILALMAALAHPASGFVVEGPRDKTGDAIEDLRRAPRWTVNNGALVAGKGRGLGGGLEYSLDGSLCSLNVIDADSCDSLHNAIAEAFEAWAADHAVLRFDDVTDHVSARAPFQRRGRLLQGAEIDLFAASALDFPSFRKADLHAHTIFYTRAVSGIRMTNGRFNWKAGHVIESVDIRFNRERCFFIDPAFSKPDCVSFPAVLLHEIGHALGIGHPEDAPERNLMFVEDQDRNNRSDCFNIEDNLQQTPDLAIDAIMIRQTVAAGNKEHKALHTDDLAARDALYPVCEADGSGQLEAGQ